MTPPPTQERIDAIKLMIIGSLLAEYGARLIIDDTKRDLKMKIRSVINAVRNVELHFLNDSRTGNENRKEFKKAFNRNETVLLADLNLTCWEINEEGLEEIITSIKRTML